MKLQKAVKIPKQIIAKPEFSFIKKKEKEKGKERKRKKN